MAIDLAFRRRAVRSLTNEIGCYFLCDLDQVPIYVGQSVDEIRAGVKAAGRGYEAPRALLGSWGYHDFSSSKFRVMNV